MSLISEGALSAAYAAAHEGLAFYAVADPGTLLINGETRIDYLQRQSTNDLGLLTAGRAVPNILTSARGRVLEVFTLIHNKDAILLMTQPGHAAGLAAYFKSHLFFNDHVSIEDHSSQWVQLELHGPGAAAALADLGFASAPALDEVQQIDFGGQPLCAIGEDGFVVSLGTKVLIPKPAVDQLTSRLKDLGAASLDFQTRELLRIESDRPGAPEFVDANTPFEIGLDRYVSAEKGCYTGQEVLARQVTYDKIVRHLARVTAARPIPAGATVQVEGTTIGTISSAASSARLGHLALAVVRKPYEQAGTALEILVGDQTISAKVV